MAVLPTPGSPTKIGLFLLRLDKMCSVRRISWSRPITGSSLPALAISFKFLAYLFRALNCASSVWEEMVVPLRRSLIAAINPLSVSPASFNNLALLSFPCRMASSKYSTLTNSSPKVLSALVARSITLFISLLTFCAGSALCTLGNLLMLSSTLVSTKATLTLFFFNKNSIGESSSLNKAFNKCSVSILGFLLLKACCCDCATASCALMVKLFRVILYNNFS